MVLAEQILEIELVVIQISRKNSGFGFQKSIPFTLYLSGRGGNFKCKTIDNLYPEPWALLKSCVEGEHLGGLLQGEVIFPEVFAATRSFHIER